MPKPKPSAVVFAKDVQKLARFYRDVVGMAEVYAGDDHVVLDDSGFQLVVHAIPKKISASIHIAQPPQVRGNTPIKLCLPVENIAQARIRAAQLGGEVYSERKEWQARGFTACDGFDPEGNVFQVRESAQIVN